jgi:hypothetical protein
MQAKTGAIRDAVSTDYGPVAAGAAVQADLKTAFPNRINQTARALNDKVANLVGHDTVVPVDNTLGKTRQLTTPIRGAEATSGDLVLPRIAKIGENLRTDVYGPRANPAPTLNADNPTLHAALTPEVPQLPVGNSSLWNVPVEPTVPMAQMATTPPPRAPVVLDSLTNLPKKSAALPPLPQRTGPNPTLNLPLSAAVPQQPVANPYVWNVPVAPRIPLPQRSTGPTAPGTPFSSLMNAQKNPGLPYGALKALRTSIGEEAASNAIIGTPEQGQFKQLYGAMSQDMRHAADASDRTRAQVPTGPMRPSDQPATRALSRANRYYSNAMDQVEALNGLANRPTPEGAYGAVANSLKAGPSIYQRLRNAVTPETRQKVAATVIDELGSATPGQQNADGTAWSPRTFLTNYNRIDPQARTELFKRLPGGADHAENLAHVAKAADMLSEGAGVWANPSGTSQALVARGALGTIGAGVVGGLFYTPLIAPAAVAGGSLLLANQVSQRLLLNPKFVNWLAKAPPVKTPQQAAAYAQRLMMAAKMTNDPQFSQDASAYLEQAGLVPDASITPLDQLPRKQGAK